MFDMEDDNDSHSLATTSLDLARLENMDVGDELEAECGKWRVLKYKNDYVLLIFGSDIINLVFTEYDKLVQYLTNNRIV